jgi:hypothetical protein
LETIFLTAKSKKSKKLNKFLVLYFLYSFDFAVKFPVNLVPGAFRGFGKLSHTFGKLCQIVEKLCRTFGKSSHTFEKPSRGFGKLSRTFEKLFRGFGKPSQAFGKPL